MPLFALPAQGAPVLKDAKTLEITELQLLSAVQAIAPGKAFYVGLHVKLKDGWHTYAADPGDAGIPTTIRWTLPQGFSAEPIVFPPHATFKEGDLTTYGYSGEVMLPVRIEVPQALPQGEYALTAKAELLVCMEICIPQTATLTLNLPVGDPRPSEYAQAIEKDLPPASAQAQASASPSSAPPSGSLGAALLLAFLGGLILNLMPCVFPVLSLKALKIAKHAHLNRRQAMMESLFYTLGILVCFMLIAGLLLVLKAGGEAIGWGYQMQSATFVATLALLVFAIGLNLSGFFELPVLLGNAGAEEAATHPLAGSFATGMLATLIATPCTAPFMATAIGYALAEDNITSLLVFLSLGLGLASPFLLMAAFPRLVTWLPKPGAWMLHFRQFLAFPMYASSVWLVWVLATQTGAHGVLIVLMASVAITFALWIWQQLGRKLIAMALIFSTLMASLTAIHMLDIRGNNVLVAQEMDHEGVAFEAKKLERMRAEGIPVFVDATASWCITCQVNYHTTLGKPEVQNAFRTNNIVFMVADWTRQNPEITAFLQSFGHSGVPLYVYFPPHGEPVVLPQILTPKIVLEVIGAK